MSPSSPWGPLSLEPGEIRELRVGTLWLALERAGDELWIRHLRLQPGVDAPPSEAEGGPQPEWTRWAVAKGAEIHLVPAVPDRPVVVSHERPFNLPPRGEARVFVRIPLHVQVSVRDRRGEYVALDLPSVVLSDTWWGGYTAGELAYWITSKARGKVKRELFEPHLAMCPFELTNASAEPLPITRFAVGVPHLTLFEAEEGLWTDQVRVLYEASSEGSEVGFGGKAPPDAPRARRLVAPRAPAPKGIRAITFDRLRSISPLGF